MNRTMKESVQAFAVKQVLNYLDEDPEKAIPKSNLTFAAGADMKAILAPFYQILFDADPTSIGGKIPANEFYYGA